MELRKLKVGVIGLGEVAQIIHLPILESLSDCYELAAFCDVSRGLLEWAGARYGVAQLYEDAHEMVKQPDLDAVFILNSSEFHAECAIAAMEQGKHVLIEKPMTLTMEDADAVIRASDKYGVKAMVGYMRRYAPAFTQAVEEMKQLGPVQYAVIRGIIGKNPFFTTQTSNVRRFHDIPEEAAKLRRDIFNRKMAEELGDVPQEVRVAYSMMLGLSSHDISAMRELLGMPKRVVSAVQWGGGYYMTATLEFDGFYATYQMGMDDIRRFDAHIEVIGKAKQLKVQYNTPYIRHLPTMLHIGESREEGYVEQVHRPTFKDPYTVEIEQFYDCVTQDLIPKTSPADYKNDLLVFQMITEKLLQSYRA